jgi:hypothetical protein
VIRKNEEGPTGLLTAWGAWRPNAAPFALRADWTVLNSPRSAKALVVFQSWPQGYKAPDFPPRDSRLHLGLLPEPYVGNLRRASIYVLGLNPGVGPHDYYGEYEVPAPRRALLANLKQEFGSGRLPFLFLDPQFSWQGWFEWWHGKLAAVIDQLAKEWGIPFASARASLARKLTSLELVPYHSKAFRNHGGWLRNLASVALAQTFVREFVLPRVERDEAIAIVLRKPRLWGLPKHPRIIHYTPRQARAAHLTPESPRGRATLKHLLRRYGPG